MYLCFFLDNKIKSIENLFFLNRKNKNHTQRLRQQLAIMGRPACAGGQQTKRSGPVLAQPNSGDQLGQRGISQKKKKKARAERECVTESPHVSPEPEPAARLSRRRRRRRRVLHYPRQSLSALPSSPLCSPVATPRSWTPPFAATPDAPRRACPSPSPSTPTR